MQRSVGVAVLGVLWAGPALALSCVPISVEALYTRAAEASEAYVPVLGQITGTTLSPKPPREPGFSAGQIGTGTFTGHYVSGTGELVPWATPITVETFCAASWCGSVPLGREILGFLRVDGAGYVFESHACPNALSPPAPADITRLQNCLRGADCTPEF